MSYPSFSSKNSQYLDPKHKKIAKQVFEQERRIQNYYNFQSKIYDLTRWSFLFGRQQIIRLLPFSTQAPFSILEVGCGTGYNLNNICQNFPNAQVVGIDISPEMIRLTKKKINTASNSILLLNQAYDSKTSDLLPKPPGVILFSYALTMINPQWKELVLQAKKDLTAIGYIAVVDFHYSSFPWFRKHMQNHHVRMEKHILPFLQDNFEPVHQSVNKAYLGLWQYFTFIGKLVD